MDPNSATGFVTLRFPAVVIQHELRAWGPSISGPHGKEQKGVGIFGWALLVYEIGGPPEQWLHQWPINLNDFILNDISQSNTLVHFGPELKFL